MQLPFFTLLCLMLYSNNSLYYSVYWYCYHWFEWNMGFAVFWINHCAYLCFVTKQHFMKLSKIWFYHKTNQKQVINILSGCKHKTVSSHLLQIFQRACLLFFLLYFLAAFWAKFFHSFCTVLWFIYFLPHAIFLWFCHSHICLCDF